LQMNVTDIFLAIAKKLPKGEQATAQGAAAGRRITDADTAPRSAPNCCK